METIFQYPQSDRAHCNPETCRAGRWPHSLSVSSVGSSPLQLCCCCCCCFISFSILSRIEPTATAAGRRPPPLPVALSVSSVGSSPLQRRRRRWFPPVLTTFSILSRIEPTATPRSPGSWFSVMRLSVSSVGSSPLQPRSSWPSPPS